MSVPKIRVLLYTICFVFKYKLILINVNNIFAPNLIN